MDTSHVPQDQFISIGAVNTRYWAAGSSGPPLILVHGLGQFVECWMYNIPDLARHFRVYALDLPGFGKSDKPDAPLTYDYFAQFLTDFMNALNIPEANLIGHSLGGAVLLRFAMDFPAHAKHLALVGSEGLGEDAALLFRLLSLPLIGDLLARPSRNGTEKLYQEAIYDERIITEELIDLGYRMASLPGAKKAFLKTLRTTIHFSGYKSEVIDPIRLNLDKIKVPALILWGQQDTFHPVSEAHFAGQHLPNATLHLFDKCGHVPMIEYPEEFTTAVIRFLSG